MSFRFVMSGAIVFAALAMTTSARATLIIQPTFASSITSLSNASQVEASIDAGIDAIDALYANTGTVTVLFEYNSSLGGGGESDTADFTTSYANWNSVMTTNSTANPANTTLSTALQSLPSSSAETMQFTGAYAYLMFGPSYGATASATQCFDASGTFHSGCDQTYSAVVTVSGSGSGYYTASPGDNSLATSVVEHELDEVLGGGGAGTTLGQGGSNYGVMDFYRYASGDGSDCNTSPGHPLGAASHTTSTSAITCYSINGGASAITDAYGNPIQFNQTGGGSDYGDFAAPPGDYSNIQDAYTSGNPVLVYSTSSPEYTMMESIGYDPIPEPATIAVFAVGLPWLVWQRRRAKGLARAV